MRNSKTSGTRRKIMHSKPILVILGLLILVFAWNVASFVGRLKETAKNKKIAEDNIAELNQAKIKLSADIAKLNTEQGVEENIREKFGLAKEGEGMIVVVDDKNLLPIEGEKKQGGVFNWFKNLFK